MTFVAIGTLRFKIFFSDTGFTIKGVWVQAVISQLVSFNQLGHCSVDLTLCILGNFHVFGRQLIIFQLFPKKSLRNTNIVLSNSLDPGLA